MFFDDTVVCGLTIEHKELENNKYCCTAKYSLDQPIRTDKITSATEKNTDVKTSRITFEEINTREGMVTFFINREDFEALEHQVLTLLGHETYINTETLENRLCDVTEGYFKSRTIPRALENLIKRSPPVLNTKSDLLPVSRERYPVDEEYLDAIIDVIDSMHSTCICIQGPPGTGKTFTAKHVISFLVRKGKRVGVMSNSHAAIMNLLVPVTKNLPGHNLVKIGGFATSSEFKSRFPIRDYPKFFYRPSMRFTKKQPYKSFSVVGATAYGFAKEDLSDEPLDYLFVDEASQVALANLVSVSQGAKNIVLLGDQMQLEQPVQGVHPGEAGMSALDYFLKDFSVIPDNIGIFLERTYRMHPDVCKPLSDVVYEGRLSTHPANQNQTVVVEKSHYITRRSGILFVPVDHEDDAQSSEAEVAVVEAIVNELKTGIFIDCDQQKKSITADDILIIAPYNMQVNLIKEKLANNSRVGTIDKFQGQEAPIVIISMAVCAVEDSPRGMDFVFDIKRLNVAVSRAKSLAIIVANKNLEHCKVKSLNQMEKVSFFCSLKENNTYGQSKS